MAGHQCASMRLLPGGSDHVRHCAAAGETQSHRCGYRYRNVGEYMPLWHVHPHSNRHQTGRRRKRWREMSAEPEMFTAVKGLSRREFLSRLQAAGGLLLIADMFGIAKAADAPKYGAEGMEHGTVDSSLVFLAIAEDGLITIIVHRSEMGQGVRTGMPLIVADELEADWARVRVQQAPADEVKYGNQDTDGSRSTRHFLDPMRRCGAAARQMLEQAAALSWNVAVGEVRA